MATKKRSEAKTVGGVRVPVKGRAPASRQVATPKKVATKTKTVGGLTTVLERGGVPLTGSHMRSCKFNCPGEYRHGKWLHSQGCPWAPVLYKADGKGKEDWCCHYNCEPTVLAVGWTHHWACRYWKDWDAETPF